MYGPSATCGTLSTGTELVSGRRAKLTLLDEQGDRLAFMTFFGPEVGLGVEFGDGEVNATSENTF
jgi:hypothetical protein